MKRKLGKVPVDHCKLMGLFIPISGKVDLKMKDGICGSYNQDYREIEFDPDHATPETIIHEIAHAYRHALGIMLDETPKQLEKEELETNRIEQAIVDTIINNPKLVKWLIGRLTLRAKRQGKR